MPVMDGYKVLSMIRADPRNAGVKIIVISAVSDRDEINDVLGLGADAYMIKPIKREEFLEQITRLSTS